jgi:anti-sigma factor RsiW
LRSSAAGQARGAPVPPAAPPPARPEAVERPASQPSRIGKINVTGYFPPEVKASLRLVQARHGGTLQDILAEALNDLFVKYGVPETAPRGTGK